jgi:streptomycin 6-kinase
LSRVVIIPEALAAACALDDERRAWLGRLPETIHRLEKRWRLILGAPFQGEDVSCSWVAPAARADGTTAVLKIGMPHFEGRDEIAGLRFWNGDPTVYLLDSDEAVNAMLLENCPGRPLRVRPEPEQDVVIASLLRRLWRTPPADHPFRPLSVMIDHWIAETTSKPESWGDEGIVREGLRVFAALRDARTDAVVLATDLHAGNVLESRREPWLVIDPKPFVGDPAYDATQHLLNCTARLRKDPLGTIRRFADLLAADADRMRLWLFARVAAGPTAWSQESAALARTLA